jgi:hypothetical protein
LSRNAHTENPRNDASLSYVVGSAHLPRNAAQRVRGTTAPRHPNPRDPRPRPPRPRTLNRGTTQPRHPLARLTRSSLGRTSLPRTTRPDDEPAGQRRAIPNTLASPMEHTMPVPGANDVPRSEESRGGAGSSSEARVDERRSRVLASAFRLVKPSPMYTCAGPRRRRRAARRNMLHPSVSETALDTFPGIMREREPDARSGFLVVDSTKARHLLGSGERIFSVSYEGSGSFFYFLGQA